jgi:hypothetical protein
MAFSKKALRPILDAEGLDQPGKWPGGASGVTIGIGYALGYVTEDQFESDWASYFTVAHEERLKTCIGIQPTFFALVEQLQCLRLAHQQGRLALVRLLRTDSAVGRDDHRTRAHRDPFCETDPQAFFQIRFSQSGFSDEETHRGSWYPRGDPCGSAATEKPHPGRCDRRYFSPSRP